MNYNDTREVPYTNIWQRLYGVLQRGQSVMLRIDYFNNDMSAGVPYGNLTAIYSDGSSQYFGTKYNSTGTANIRNDLLRFFIAFLNNEAYGHNGTSFLSLYYSNRNVINYLVNKGAIDVTAQSDGQPYIRVLEYAETSYQTIVYMFNNLGYNLKKHKDENFFVLTKK